MGDDLRQDALVMQLLRVMSDIWKREGLDMRMRLYDCISTGYERGLLQVVLNATTLGNILLQATDNEKSRHGGAVSKGGSIRRKLTSAMKALTDFDVLREWIWDQICIDFPEEDEEILRAEMVKLVNHQTYIYIYFFFEQYC